MDVLFVMGFVSVVSVRMSGGRIVCVGVGVGSVFVLLRG